MNDDSLTFSAQYHPADYPDAFVKKYIVVKCLASSSQGETLLVFDKGNPVIGVAKVMPAGQSDREAELLEKLSHPALPKLLDRYERGDMRLHVREFVQGTPLDEALQEGAFSERKIVSIGMQLCDVLSYLHLQTPPVIHRDIKPSNLIYGKDNRLSLIDFGISREYNPDVRQDTFVSGTDRYAPPEQYGFAQTDARADLYSTGMVLRFLLTNGDLKKRIHNHSLRRIVARCTRFAPKERWRSALALKRALHGYRRRLWEGIAAAVLAVMLLCVGLTVGRPWIKQILTDAEPPIVWMEPSIEKAVRLALDKPEGKLSREELAQVTELYLMQDTPAVDMLGFYDLIGDYYAGRRSKEPGSVSLLDDLAMLPNLRKLGLAGEQIGNIQQVALLTKLEWLEMKHNQIVDISPIAELRQLRYVGFTNNYVADISPLAKLPYLNELDLTFGAQGADMSPIAEMGNFVRLSLSGCRDSYKVLSGKRINRLVLSYSGMDSLVYIADVRGLTSLDIAQTQVTDLAGIEAHPDLKDLNIAGTAITDLSPLYDLHYLTTLTVSPDVQVDTSLFHGYFGLTVQYQ
ncbi:MAG: protein kinase [Clostridia bacterium]